MPHLLRAIDNFFKAYVPIRNHLESASHENLKAEGLAKIAKDGHVIVFLLSLKELLKPMVRLSLCLQKENLTLADASTHLVVTKSVLEKLCTEEKESIREVFDKSVFMDSDVTFPDYGNEQLSVVVDHFSSVLTTEKSEILEEWQILKALMSEKFGKELVAGDLQWSDVWRAFRNQGVDKVLLVIDLLRTLPPTSVRNECAFSVMKLTKTRRRGRLSAKSLNNLLTVSLQADSVQDFQPRPAIEKFMVPTSGRTRRFAGYTKKSSETATSTSPVLESASPVHVIDECEDEAALSSQVMSYQKMYDGDDDYDTEDEWSDEDEENERTEKEIENVIFMYSRE